MISSKRAFLLAAATILCYQLILPPVVGLADNGDFSKITGRFDLYAPIHRVYEYVDTIYEIRPDKHWVSEFYSTEILLVVPALWLNALISKADTFDLRFIGVVHGALFLAALWLFTPLIETRPRWMRWSIYFLVLLFFCDVVYVSSLNSFYMDEPAYLFLLLSIVFYLRLLRWQRKRDAILLIVSAFLLAGSKTQHALLGFFLALLFAAAARTHAALARRWWYAAAAGLCMAVLAMSWKAQPADYTGYPLYNVTFEKILPHAWNADRTMKQLGLDESYRPYIGMKAYLPNSGMDDPEFRQRFMQRLSFGKLALFYLRHPSVMKRTMVDALSEAGQQQSFGNFDIATGYPRLAESRAFSIWSNLKSRLFFRHGGRFLNAFLLIILLLAALLVLERRILPQSAWLAGLCLIAGASLEMAISTLCDSMDIARHSMVFLVLFDMVVLVNAGLILHAVEMRGRFSRKSTAERFDGTFAAKH